MIWMCLVLVAIAVLLGVRRPYRRDLADRLAADPPPERRLSPRVAVRLVGLGLAPALIVAAGVLGGARAGVLTAAGLIVLATAGWLGQQRTRTRLAMRAQAEVAHACEVLASQLRVGQVPAEALATAAEDCPVLTDARRVHGVGGEVTTVWRRQSTLPGHGGLLELARSWEVSEQTGAPLSAALQQVASSLSAEQSLRTIVAGELAAPRATSKVMAALPVCGIGMGYLLGGDPVAWLLDAPLGWACLVLGVTLGCAGVAWIELLARRASATE